MSWRLLLLQIPMLFVVGLVGALVWERKDWRKTRDQSSTIRFRCCVSVQLSNPFAKETERKTVTYTLSPGENLTIKGGSPCQVVIYVADRYMATLAERHAPCDYPECNVCRPMELGRATLSEIMQLACFGGSE